MPKPPQVRQHQRRQKLSTGEPVKLGNLILKRIMTRERILGLIRHVLTFGGGYLVAQGKIDDAGMQEGIAAIITLAGIIWSAMAPEKKQP